MAFGLIRAIKSTHRHPINRILHCIGMPLYVIGIVLVAGYFTDLHTNSATGITLWLIVIGLFLTGHKIEGNLRAMTLIIPGKISDIENLIETYKYNQYIMQRTRLDNIGLHIIRLLARDSRTTYRNIGINKRLKTTSAKNIVESFYTDCFLCLDNKNRTNITQSMPKVLLDSHKA